MNNITIGISFIMRTVGFFLNLNQSSRKSVVSISWIASFYRANSLYVAEFENTVDLHNSTFVVKHIQKQWVKYASFLNKTYGPSLFYGTEQNGIMG